MTELRIQLFGKFTLQAADRPVTALDSGKAQELLAYLLAYRDRPHRREALAEVLWQASSTAQAKKYLRQALWQLQQMLSEVQAEQLIVVEPDWIRISPEAAYWLDVAEFESAFQHAHGLPGEALSVELAGDLRQAAALYRGDLLEGWYADWCLYERERLQNVWLATLDKLMSYCEVRREFEAGLSYGAKVLRKDRARERTHRRLMRLAYLAGDRTGALRQYQRCEQALREELNVRPGRRTEALRAQILNDSLEPAGSGEYQDRPAPAADRLEPLRDTLTRLARHVRDDLAALDRALSDLE